MIKLFLLFAFITIACFIAWVVLVSLALRQLWKIVENLQENQQPPQQIDVEV